MGRQLFKVWVPCRPEYPSAFLFVYCLLNKTTQLVTEFGNAHGCNPILWQQLFLIGLFAWVAKSCSLLENLGPRGTWLQSLANCKQDRRTVKIIQLANCATVNSNSNNLLKHLRFSWDIRTVPWTGRKVSQEDFVNDVRAGFILLIRFLNRTETKFQKAFVELRCISTFMAEQKSIARIFHSSKSSLRTVSKRYARLYTKSTRHPFSAMHTTIFGTYFH